MDPKEYSPSSRNTEIASGLRAHSCISVPTTMSGTWQEPNKHWPRSHPRHQKPTWRAFENPQRIRGLRDRLRSTSPHSLVEYQKKKKKSSHFQRNPRPLFTMWGLAGRRAEVLTKTLHPTFSGGWRKRCATWSSEEISTCCYRYVELVTWTP